MSRRKIASVGPAIGLAMTASLIVMLLSPLPANAVWGDNCKVAPDATSPAKETINGVVYIVGHGGMRCTKAVYRAHVYEVIQINTGDGFSNAMTPTEANCYNLPDMGGCPGTAAGLVAKIPLSQCVHNAAYRTKTSGWYVFHQGGTQYTVDAKFSVRTKVFC